MKKIIIAGYGFLSKNLVRSIHEQGLDLSVVGISEIHGYLYDPNGLRLKDVIEKKMDSLPSFKKGTTPDMIKEANADILVELTPTNAKTGEPGYTHIKLALEKGLNVVASNKGPFITHFQDIMRLSKQKGKSVRYDATVGGAIPTIALITDLLRGDQVESVFGILNGTTNYILSTMYHQNRPFDNVLREAQELGYAEADPTYDIDGIDAAGKLVILVNTLFGMDKKVDDVKVTGIRKINPEAMKLAAGRNMVIKLICYADKDRMEVSPMLLPADHPLNVEGTLNALLFKTKIHGDLTLIGRGAGKETVGAILNDILSL
jgi:homoserine dehydrogenase